MVSTLAEHLAGQTCTGSSYERQELFKSIDRGADPLRVTTRSVPGRELTPQRVESRWRKGTTTFGPVGRLSWTAVIVILPIFVVVFGGFAGILFFAAWCGIVAPMALRDLWKKDWAYTPGSLPPPRPALTSYDGRPIQSLGEYVAGQTQPPAP